MNRLTSRILKVRRPWVVSLGFALWAPVFMARAAADQGPVDRFLASLDADRSLPAEARSLIRKTWADCRDCDENEFLTQGLAVLSPRFRAALDAFSAERYQRCVEVLRELRSDPNPFISVHAAVYEIKALVAMEQLDEAGAAIRKLVGTEPVGGSDVASYSYFAPGIAFLRGYCLLAGLEYDEAADALEVFLRTYPDASDRLVIAAKQMLAELGNRVPERIGDVHDLMVFAGRHLKHGRADDTVQDRQQRIIELLDKLIDEAEQQESSSSSAGASGNGRQGGRAPSNPMQRSQLPGGRPPEGPLGPRRRANPAEVWGTMPPGERERILQALRDSFPSRYRQLVEQYYEELAKKP